MREIVRTLLPGLALAAGLTGAASTGPATAAEQLVMPFSCSVIGGQVMLAPAAPQSYAIYGRAEHKRLTTCSPYDPRKCHNWSVHRFDLDCGGVRTSWQSVVRALAPILAESAGDAYAPYGGPGYGDQGRAGAYRQGAGGGVAFPRGFAPNPMNVARFTGTSPVVADIPLPPKKPEAAPPSADSQVAANETSSGPDVPDLDMPDLDVPAVPDLAIPEPAAADVAAAEAQAADTASDKTPAAPKASDVAGYRSLKVEFDSEATGSLPKSGESATLWRNASTIFMWTLAVLFALSATLLLGRQRILERLPMPPRLLQLRGPAQPPAVRTPDPEPDTEAVRQKEVTASRLRLWDEDWLPRTMLEAFDVLGVDPDASRDKMKTTVTRLRRALHPDHAIDDEDRNLRERRLKQINVAWEIIAGKRRVPWLKQSG